MKRHMLAILLVFVMLLAVPMTVLGSPGVGGGGSGPPPFCPPGPLSICIFDGGYDYPAYPGVVAPRPRPCEDDQGEDQGNNRQRNRQGQQ